MSAVKIIFKRSSLLGKRPTNSNLEPGEIGLNTNSTDPGLFFETNSGSVVKVGPTSYLPAEPTQIPARGELWVDSDTKTLSIGTQENNWQKVAAPFLGGTSGLTVFVAPEYENATDSLANDGQTVPFITINRAVLEVSKQIILDTLSGVSLGNNRYLIMLAPGRHCVENAPGRPLSTFNVDYSSNTQSVTQEDLTQFNAEEVGGVILPRGVSIIGLDLKKCELHPTYVPKYSHPAFPGNFQQEAGGPIYRNEPASSIFRWSGNTYVTNFTGLDKIEERTVVKVTSQDVTNYALFRTERPHGLQYNDFVQINYTAVADQSASSFLNGAYYVYPLNCFEFIVSAVNFDNEAASPVLAATMPPAFFDAGDSDDPKFSVANIYPYYIPPDGTSYELSPYSHHRLSIFKNASLKQLDNFYQKVQKAFPTIFQGQVAEGLATSPEYVIVAPTDGGFPNNLSSNSTNNSSPYQNQVNHRSDYGMANGDYDGNLVSGFKSVIINSATAVILQKDPAPYELYSASSQDWIKLTEYTQQQLGGTLPITSIPTENQLQLLNEAAIPDIRYYYSSIKVADPNGAAKSTGIPDPDNDFRHFGFRISGANSFMQAQSTYTIGAAIGCWAREGGTISLTNATTNFGSVAFQADGFAGIGTLGGANDINRGFLQAGVFRPLALSYQAATADEQKRVLRLGSKVVQVGPDPNNPGTQLIYMQKPFDPASILPYSLKPGSAVFTTEADCTFSAYFVNDGSSTCILAGDATQNPFSPGGAVFRVRQSDSTIPNGPVTSQDVPYIRRFIDPRSDADKSYGFYIQSTNPTSAAPDVGSVLRLNQTGQNLSNTLKRNYQFDPGQYGGIAQTFTVDLVRTEQYSLSFNFNYKVADASQSTNYVVYTSLTDNGSPAIQSVPSDLTDLNSDLVPYYNATGSYVTFDNRNYYAAENNLWTSLYYQTSFNARNGPTKVSPSSANSPFVITSALQTSEPVSESWQGVVPDPYYDYYVNGIPAPYKDELSYMRGAVIPYSEFAAQFQIDDDDGSLGMGIVYHDNPVETITTVFVSDSTVIQTAEPMTSPYAANPSFGRPEIFEAELLSVAVLTQPKNGLSVLQLSNPTIPAVEYVRVISISSNSIKAIRNIYPTSAQGTLPVTWPTGTIAKVCISSENPEPAVYDPDWSTTKLTMLRYYELMGYSRSLMAPYLQPATPGDRLLLNSSLQLSPIDGYANITASWPIEFNNASTIYANTHTWQQVGLLDYSRGLTKYKVNQLSKKLSFDYLCTSSWGGRLTVMGANEGGELVFGGPIKEALTSQFYITETPLTSAANRQRYTTPTPLLIPNSVLVFSCDDISDQFDGTTTTFQLTRGGYILPGDQLSTDGIFVFVGGAVQAPGAAYNIQTTALGVNTAVIEFTEPPVAGASCDIRIVTSQDNEETLEVTQFNIVEAFDGVRSSFSVSPSTPFLTNLNSFMFLGGIEQNPAGLYQTASAYDISYSGGTTTIAFLGGAPSAGSTVDLRGVIPGSRYRSSGASSVYINSVDDFSPLFDGAQTTFPLYVGGVAVDSTKVTAQNMFVSLGGVMQIPIAQAGAPDQGNAYSVAINSATQLLEIRFSEPPSFGTTLNLRIITSDEQITCILSDVLSDTALQDGPGIEVNDKNQIISIDPGSL